MREVCAIYIRILERKNEEIGSWEWEAARLKSKTESQVTSNPAEAAFYIPHILSRKSSHHCEHCWDMQGHGACLVPVSSQY